MKNRDLVRAELEKTIQLHIDIGNRVREAKGSKYWYPLSLPSFGAEEIAEAADSMCSFETSMWEKTSEFEKAFAKHIGCEEAVMVNSGSSADLLMCFAIRGESREKIDVDQEILVPVVTWPTQIWSVMMAGFKPVFVDADPLSFNMHLQDLESKITKKTKAIFLVHLMGNTACLDSVLDIAKRHGLIVLEDCCEALDSEWTDKKVGSFGIMGSFSFFFSHHITTMEGGMITCDSGILADKLRILRAHGWTRNLKCSLDGHENNYDVDPRYSFADWGFNLRPTEVQASFGLHQLRKLNSFTEKRAVLSEVFFRFLKNTVWLSCPNSNIKAKPSWFALPIMIWENAPFTRKELTNYLENNGIETRPIVAGCLAKHQAWKMFPEYKDTVFPGAEKIHKQAFYIGLSPSVSESMLSRAIDIFKNFLDKHK